MHWLKKKPSVGTLSSRCLCEYTQERNTITIINSENSLKGTLFNLIEHMRTSWLGNIWMQWLWISYQKSLIPWGKSEHTEKRNFLCVMNVRKASNDPFHLYRHTRIHTGEEPFKYIQCGKAISPKFPLFYITELIQRNKEYECLTSTSKDLTLKNLTRF